MIIVAHRASMPGHVPRHELPAGRSMATDTAHPRGRGGIAGASGLDLAWSVFGC